MQKEVKLQHYIVIVVDVQELIPLEDESKRGLEKEASVAKHTKELISLLQKNYHDKILYIEEGSVGGRCVQRFLFKKGGLLELIEDKPFAIKAHFVKRNEADHFLRALKKTLRQIVPENPVKEMFINDIGVDIIENDPLSEEKWTLLHNVYVRKSLLITVVAISLLALFEVMKHILEITSVEQFPVYKELVGFGVAVLFAIIFETVRGKVEFYVNKAINRVGHH